MGISSPLGVRSMGQTTLMSIERPADAPPVTSDEPVLVRIDAGVATVTLNRPETLNSLNVATKEQLRDQLSKLAADAEVRCVVLTGVGRAFCAGQDLREHQESLASGAVDLGSTVADHYNPIVTSLLTMPKPVIAAVNGVAAGAGASLAFACDLRVVAEDGSFNLAFAQVALSCDTGASWTLPKLVGHAKAMDLLLFPRSVSAREALALGLANRVVPTSELASVVGELATTLANGPTIAFAAIKASVAYAATHHLDEVLAFEREQMTTTGSSGDHREAVRAFLDKRSPTFQAR